MASWGVTSRSLRKTLAYELKKDGLVFSLIFTELALQTKHGGLKSKQKRRMGFPFHLYPLSIAGFDVLVKPSGCCLPDISFFVSTEEVS